MTRPLNDKTFDQTCDRIQSAFYGLIAALGLDRVDWDLHYIREREISCGDGHSGHDAVEAEIFPRWAYGAATVRFYVWTFVDKTEDQVADVLLHELVHYWIHPISRYGTSPEYDNLEERVCTDIARAIKSAIDTAGRQVADHWRLQVKRLEKELKALQKKEVVA